ncbi:hypothetical protein [Nonomuraea insulae]|uniref:HTH merR-type domain-containing protein n=1 Tax=Nonomuraea insulae TaxID=1616787 RepID=A0ABW1D942_9ACTN
MSDGLHTIGEPARRSGLPVRTIRFWSGSGVAALRAYVSRPVAAS